MRLNAAEQTIRKVLDDHIRMVSYDPAKPHACCCGWSGTGNKGDALKDHMARVIHRATKDRASPTKECRNVSTNTIEMHHAKGEALCRPCAYLLKGLA